MPTFGTPAPISVSLDIGAGSVEIIASDRADTVVEVRPTNPAKKIDVGAAEQTRVSYSDGTLTVKAPKNWRQYVVWSECGSVDVKIELPRGPSYGARLALVSSVSSARAVPLSSELVAYSVSARSRLEPATSRSHRPGRCNFGRGWVISPSSGQSATAK